MSLYTLREREYAIERIPALIKLYPESEEMLSFYRHILDFQLRVYKESKTEDWKKGIRFFYKLLDLCVQYGSPQLRESAEKFYLTREEELIGLISEFMKEKEGQDEERFIFISFLEPFMSKKAEKEDLDHSNWLKSRCPVCGFKAVVSFLSDTEDLQGGRFLVCQVCKSQWVYNRAKCVKCGNTEDEELHYFYDEGRRAVQLQACDRCGTYIKVIDLRIDGLAVPILEDIASVSLDLWAREMGYKKFERNVFGL